MCYYLGHEYKRKDRMDYQAAGSSKGRASSVEEADSPESERMVLLLPVNLSGR